MANTLGLYDPLFYAQEALIQLDNALGMAGRVHRGYDAAPQQKGSTINISRPSSFTVNDAPATAEDLTTDSVAINLSYWREVKFKLTDKELTHTKEKIITDHIRPAAVALANDIDVKLASLYVDVPYFKAVSSPCAVADLTALQRVMFNNKVPEDEARRHLMLDGVMREEFLNLSAFSQHQGAGEAGAETQRRGSLGMKYGQEVFANQNAQTHTGGTSDDNAGTVTGAHALGATTVVCGALGTGTIVAGDTAVIAGSSKRYAVATGGTIAANALTVVFTEGLDQALSGGEVITFDTTSGTQGIGFHSNAFALAMAPLSTIGAQLGARIETVVDPITNLALRSRMYYVGNSSEVHVALDVLYGVKTLDGELACRVVNA